ncbi:MAG TPA: hypothetical protein VHE61_12805 [Opitutaceae bacterium]|nr:hypothetical protein [Opitutaceae bacterium]
MTAAMRGAKRRWMVSAAGAALLTALCLLLIRVPAEPRPNAPDERPRPPILVNPGSQDELAMNDLTPLFLPTRYNAGPAAMAAPRPGRGLLDRDAVRLKFNEDDPALPMPPAARVPATAADVLADTPGPLAFGMGRTDFAVRAAAPHEAYVDVFAIDTGERVFAHTLAIDAHPPAAGHGNTGWTPLVFSAAVDPAGLVGPLTLVTSSGVEEVDNYFRNYLARTFRLGDRLSPGFYRVVVGP